MTERKRKNNDLQNTTQVRDREIVYTYYEKIEHSKKVVRSRKSRKDRQYNYTQKNDKKLVITRK